MTCRQQEGPLEGAFLLAHPCCTFAPASRCNIAPALTGSVRSVMRRMDARKLKPREPTLTGWRPGEWLEELPFEEEAIREELKKLQRFLKKLSPHTLDMIEGDIGAAV